MFKKKSRDDVLSIFIVAYIVMSAFNSMTKAFFDDGSAVLKIVRILIYAVLAFLLLWSLMKMSLRMVCIFCGIEILAVLPYLFSLFIGVNNGLLLSWMFTAITVCVPMLTFSFFIEDKNILYKKFINISFIVFIILAIQCITIKEDKFYDMGFSYAILFICLLHFNNFIRTKKPIYCILFIVELVLMILYGSRGGLVCFIVFVVLRLIYSDIRRTKKLVLISVLTLLSVLFVLLFVQYKDDIYSYLIANGLSSRTLGLIFREEFFSHDSGRSVVWETTFTLINQKPLLGWGISGASNLFGVDAIYPHQVFLDFMLTFGIPVGVILGIMFITIPLYSMVKTKDCVSRDIIIILVSISIVMLMFSSTIFTNYYYCLLLGVCMKELKDRRYGVKC